MTRTTEDEAVSKLLNLRDRPPPIYQGHRDPAVLAELLRTLSRIFVGTETDEFAFQHGRVLNCARLHFRVTE